MSTATKKTLAQIQLDALSFELKTPLVEEYHVDTSGGLISNAHFNLTL